MNQHLDIEHEHERIDGAIDASPREPSESDAAMATLQESVRNQIIAIAKGEISSKTMATLQRFCASVGQALVTLERPDALVRQRFGRNPYGAYMLGTADSMMDYPEDTLAASPATETYGANASRGLIESAAKIGKDIVTAQAEAQRAAKAPTITEMIASLALAKNAKLPKHILKVMEKQIEDAAAAATIAPAALALPAAIDPSTLPKRPVSKKKT